MTSRCRRADDKKRKNMLWRELGECLKEGLTGRNLQTGTAERSSSRQDHVQLHIHLHVNLHEILSLDSFWSEGDVTKPEVRRFCFVFTKRLKKKKVSSVSKDISVWMCHFSFKLLFCELLGFCFRLVQGHILPSVWLCLIRETFHVFYSQVTSQD